MQKEYPSLAEIVRQETDGGRLIVRFYLGVAYGDIEGFRDFHRAAAARRIDKIAPGLVKEYLLEYHNAQVRESMRGSRFPMGSIEPMQTEGAEPVQRGPNAFQRRLRQIVRKETAGGRNIVLFLIDVMDGTITGFKPHHRLEAAKELAAHITSDDTLSPVTGEGWDDSVVAPAQAEPTPRSIRGTQKSGAGQASQREPDDSKPETLSDHAELVEEPAGPATSIDRAEGPEGDEAAATARPDNDGAAHDEPAAPAAEPGAFHPDDRPVEEVDYAAINPADFIDSETGYTPELDHPHPSTPWLPYCKKGCAYHDHKHAPSEKVRRHEEAPRKRALGTLSPTERRLMEKGYDLGWYGSPPAWFP